MKHLWVFVFALALNSLAIAETMDKEEFIDTIAKLQACINAEHIGSEVKDLVRPRTKYFFQNHFNASEKEEVEVVIKIRAKDSITTMGYGCEAAFKKIMALPLPPK